jgi:AcrR family transcriptional regulator
VAGKKTPTPARALRADAERNRQALLTSAKSIFAEKGTRASLEEIAREAGVGIGTLYRHFPTRDALIEALYGSEVEQLVGEAMRLMETEEPVAALRGWLILFVDYIVTKNNMADVLKAIVGSSTYAETGARVKEAIDRLAGRAVASGDIALDIEPLDLLRAVAGVTNLSAGPDSTLAAKRTVDILIAGLRK